VIEDGNFHVLQLCVETIYSFGGITHSNSTSHTHLLGEHHATQPTLISTPSNHHIYVLLRMIILQWCSIYYNSLKYAFLPFRIIWNGIYIPSGCEDTMLKAMKTAMKWE
jgi:hypothetical protein